jgi:hypothetical protein
MEGTFVLDIMCTFQLEGSLVVGWRTKGRKLVLGEVFYWLFY